MNITTQLTCLRKLRHFADDNALVLDEVQAKFGVYAHLKSADRHLLVYPPNCVSKTCVVYEMGKRKYGALPPDPELVADGIHPTRLIITLRNILDLK